MTPHPRAVLPALAGLLLLAACAPPAGTGAAPPGAPPSEPASAGESPSPSATASPTAQPSAVRPAWRLLAAAAADGPAAREDHTWTLAPDGATAYLFGGRTGGGEALADLWAYDLATESWTRVEAAGPDARFGHDAAWVDGVGLVVFAGQRGSAFFSDLWAYDPATKAWERLPSGGDAPVARYGSCAAVGSDGRLWISHGFTEDLRRFADTRAYDFATGSWTDETPPGEGPIARCLHGCWWTDGGDLALYAGQTTGVTALADLWRLTPGPRQGTHSWAQVTLGGDAPPDRNLYAAARWGAGTVVLGGQALDGGYLADAWLLPDEDAPTALEPEGEAPPARAGAELVADLDGGRLLLFGGRDASDAMNDLWELALPRP